MKTTIAVVSILLFIIVSNIFSLWLGDFYGKVVAVGQFTPVIQQGYDKGYHDGEKVGYDEGVHNQYSHDQQSADEDNAAAAAAALLISAAAAQNQNQ